MVAVRVNVLDPEPGAVIVAGANAAVTPDGRPPIDKAMAESNPPETAVVTMTVPCPPGAMLAEVPADNVSAGLDGGGPVVASVQWFTSRNASGEPRPVA